MSLEYIALFMLIMFVGSIVPGPSMLLALTHGMQYGVRGAFSSGLGNVSVTLVQASVSIAGLGTALVASEELFTAIRWLGAIYLTYIGMRFLFKSEAAVRHDDVVSGEKVVSQKKLYMQGVLVTTGNPKAILFFSAILPQFIELGDNYLAQVFCLLILCGSIAFGCYMIYAVGGQQMVRLLSGSRAGNYLNRAVGGLFIAIAVWVVLSIINPDVS